MGQLEDIQTFVRVVEAGGIGRAAEQLGIAKSAVSRRLNALEDRLSRRLINRTTRTSSLTEAGSDYYRQALKLLDQVNEMNASSTNDATNLNGTLRLAAPLTFGIMHLSPAIEQFMAQHPDLKIHIDFSDRQVDIIEEGFDLALRIANLKDSSTQARKLFQSNHALLASPSYIESRGKPAQPDDLHQHDFIHYGTGNTAHVTLLDSATQQHRLNLHSKLSANNGDFLMQLAIAGHGIVALPNFMALQAVEQGKLVKLLPEFTIPSVNAYCVYPKNKFLPLRARALIDFLAQHFQTTPHWDA